MAHAKERHYWAQLRAALTAGLWPSASPAKTPHGYPISWSDLLRKFNKHCKGFHDLAEIVSQTHALSVLLSANVANEDQLGTERSGEFRLSAECMLLPERVEEATGGYETLKKLETTHSDSLMFALAYYAYALGQPAACLAYLANVPTITDVQSHIPASSTIRSDGSTLQLPGSTTDISSSWTGSFLSADPSSSTDIKDGRSWALAESIRSICLQGMSHEKLAPSEPEAAIQAYASAIPLLSILEFEAPSASNAQHSSSFAQYRELWRWSERLMFRTITLLARVRHLDDWEGLIWKFFTHYGSSSAHWPPTFRTSHRAIISVLHLRALIIRFRASPSKPITPSPSLQSEQPPQWLNTARSIINEYRAILDKCTRFPRAGERNVKVEDLVDLCVAVWEASGAVADRAQWVIDVLWWATRLTFNSYRVFRHMTRLFYVSGDIELAKRTLRLYVEVVSKTRAAGLDGDCDTDRYWVETLVEGARMLCRLALSSPGSSGLEVVKEAGELVERAKTRLDATDKELVALVALAEGVWNTVTAITTRDPETRPQCLRNALENYIRSVQTFPAPSAYHQLALALALPGPSQNLEEAVVAARAAVENCPNEIRHWHLLGLLLTAQGQWVKAREVLEIGAAMNESPTPLDTDDPPNNTEPTAANETLVHEMILAPDAITIPPSATLLCGLSDHPNPTPQDAFEYALQLRLTQMALTEHIEGAEGAEGKWVEVFGWIAERKGTVSETQLRSSVDTGSRSAATQVEAIVIITEPKEEHLHEIKTEFPTSIKPESTLTTTTLEPPPITVTPATPADPDRGFPMPPLHKAKRSFSTDPSTGKKVQQMLKSRVHKGQEKISTISKKIGHGVVRNGSLHLKRSISAPDFHAILHNHHYQASSIHSRRRLRSLMRQSISDDSDGPVDDRPPPPPQLPPTPESQPIPQASREDKLLSELWAASAATFRRLGKIDQAKGAIQEAEVKNQENPAVWVQFGLYHHALNHDRQAIEAFKKALFMSPDDVSAAVHMCRIYLTPPSTSQSQSSETDLDPDKVDLSAGLLKHMTRGPGWDVPEAWYYLAKAYGLRGQKDKQRECLTEALSLSEGRCIRDIGRAVGWCL